MKKIVAWTLLVIYLNAAAQPLMPWVSDVLAHTFYWHDHLEHVHHGLLHSHHLNTEMAATGHDNDSFPVTTHSFLFDKDLLSTHLAPNSLALPGTYLPLDHLSFPAWQFHYKSIPSEVLIPPPNGRVLHHSFLSSAVIG